MVKSHFHDFAHAQFLRNEAIRIAKRVPVWRTTKEHCRIVYGNFADVVSLEELMGESDRRRHPKKVWVG